VYAAHNQVTGGRCADIVTAALAIDARDVCCASGAKQKGSCHVGGVPSARFFCRARERERLALPELNTASADRARCNK
jgi:hypothetical protein